MQRVVTLRLRCTKRVGVLLQRIVRNTFPPYRELVGPTLCVAALWASVTAAVAASPSAPASSEGLYRHPIPTTVYPVLRVADGDTITVDRLGRKEKIRLLNVDTEEAGEINFSDTSSKPNTQFGNECRDWATLFFRNHNVVGLWQHQGAESRGAFGRLLAHVVLSDGSDFNLLLVRTGKSPYYNKYGNSNQFDAEFREAQQLARQEELGIWSPDANPDGPKRPYDLLLPWWEARAKAIDLYRTRAADQPGLFFDATSTESLERATRSSTESQRVTVFGLPQAVYVEGDGNRTVVFRSSTRTGALRVRISSSAYAEHEASGLFRFQDEFHQNYVWVTGQVRQTPTGFEMESSSPDQWVFEPQYPPLDVPAEVSPAAD